ncbi:hypothetical protein ACVIW2_003536 [Bradyrhizobium huanghuaihaiense]
MPHRQAALPTQIGRGPVPKIVAKRRSEAPAAGPPSLWKTSTFGRMVGVAGFEPATPASRTEASGCEPLILLRFLHYFLGHCLFLFMVNLGLPWALEQTFRKRDRCNGAISLLWISTHEEIGLETGASSSRNQPDLQLQRTTQLRPEPDSSLSLDNSVSLLVYCITPLSTSCRPHIPVIRSQYRNGSERKTADLTVQNDAQQQELLYLACPYSDPSEEVRLLRFKRATKAAAALIRRGHIVFSPITMTHPIDIELAGSSTLGSDFWVTFDQTFMERCDVFVLLPLDGWRSSAGVWREIDYFRSAEKPLMSLNDDYTFKPLELSSEEREHMQAARR